MIPANENKFDLMALQCVPRIIIDGIFQLRSAESALGRFSPIQSTPKELSIKRALHAGFAVFTCGVPHVFSLKCKLSGAH
jgi:hypothetical protein